jgi:hypothetical protein
MLVIYMFSGHAMAATSCEFVYYNNLHRPGGPSTAATAQAACSLANYTVVDSGGAIHTNTFTLGALQFGSPQTNDAVYSCPGRELITPSDPAHCDGYPGGAAVACGTGYADEAASVRELAAYPQFSSVNTCPQYHVEYTPRADVKRAPVIP